MAGWSLRPVQALMARRRGVRRSAANAPVRHGRDDGADRRAWATRESERREREGVKSLTGGADLSAEAWAREVGPPGPGKGGEKRGRDTGWARIGPAEGEGFFSFSFSDFYFFSFPFLLLFLFISFSFESIIF
jgi:hypothetical protein